MQKNNVNNAWRFEGRSPLVLLLLSLIVIIATLPMSSCYFPAEVNEAQYSLQSFNAIGCKGTYNADYLRRLSQICFDHTHGYDDPAYSNCRAGCFATEFFKSYAAMSYATSNGVQNANAWTMYSGLISTLNGPR